MQYNLTQSCGLISSRRPYNALSGQVSEVCQPDIMHRLCDTANQARATRSWPTRTPCIQCSETTCTHCATTELLPPTPRFPIYLSYISILFIDESWQIFGLKIRMFKLKKHKHTHNLRYDFEICRLNIPVNSQVRSFRRDPALYISHVSLTADYKKSWKSFWQRFPLYLAWFFITVRATTTYFTLLMERLTCDLTKIKSAPGT